MIFLLVYILLLSLFFNPILCISSTKARTLFHACLPKTPNASPAETPIIILHGLLGSSRNFQSWARLLGKELNSNRDIVCMDLRNHGRSSVAYGALDMDYDTMAMDVIHTIKTLGLNSVHIIGHSVGGKVAAASALKSDAELQIKSLVMMDISPIPYAKSDFLSVIDTVNILYGMQKKINQETTKEEIASLVSQEFSEKNLQAFLLSGLQASLDGYRWSFNVNAIYESLDAIRDFDLKNVDGFPSPTFPYPMLVMKAADSPFVRSTHVAKISKLFPKYNMVNIKNAGHWLHFDQPQVTVEKVKGFIESVEAWHESQ